MLRRIEKGQDNESNLIIYANLVFAIASIPLTLLGGEGVKYLLAPYIAYMVLTKQSNYFPALLVHFSLGSTLSFVILFCCLGLALSHYRLWRRLNLTWLFVFSVLPLPFFLWQSYHRIVELRLGLVDVLNPLTYYLGIFAFFYGVLISKKLGKKSYEAILVILAVIVIIQVWDVSPQSLRFYFFALPAISVLTIYTFIKYKFQSVPFGILALGLICLLSFMLNLGSSTFTLIFSIFYCSMLLFFKLSSFGRTLYSAWIFAVMGCIIVAVMFFTSASTVQNLKGFDEKKKFDVGDSDAWKQRLVFKAFGDRVPVWNGAWKQIRADYNILPPISPNTFEIKTASGDKVEIEFGAHNLYLELIRNYGFLIGVMVGLSFIWIISLGGRLLQIPNQNIYLLVTAASVFAVGLIGSMFGQFPLMLTFSFLIMGLAGVSFGRYSISLYQQRFL